MELSFFVLNGAVILKLLVAVLLGMMIGAERRFVHKEAGMKTHALVSLGAAVFVVVSEAMTAKYLNLPGLNPTMIVSQIVVGIGFLGAGLIIFRGDHISGLTTAAGLWVAAGIGVAVGYGLYQIAIAVTLITFFIFSVLWYIEQKVKKFRKKSHQETDAQDS